MGRELGAQLDANLIASSIVRLSSYLQRKSKELFHSIVYQTPTTGLTATAVKRETGKGEEELKNDGRKEEIFDDEPKESEIVRKKEIFDDEPKESVIVPDIPNTATKETFSSQISDT